MSFDTRNNSALMKRAEQLRRWEESDTNREPTVPKNEKGRKIKFSSGCVFLAACVSGDKDEVVRLLETGADINTANVDGLTALHQACIDDNLEMVEFLVEHGADINRQDNEGWTPLHATSSCGFVSIARYLIENSADLTAINSDGELAIDLASTDGMADYLQNLIDEQGIDCTKARQIEEQVMLNDAKKWLRSDASEADKPHPKTGATALHVAAAKGYSRVLGLLLAGRANVDKQDNDGWTPLHAAAHWGQKEASQMLVSSMADIEIKNYAGQTPVDVAEPKIIKFLEELKANNKRTKRRPASQIRISDTIENNTDTTPSKLIRVEVKNDEKGILVNEEALSSLERISESEETDSDVTDSTESSHSTSISDHLEDKPKPPSEPAAPLPTDSNSGDDETPWRRTGSARTRSQPETPQKPQVPDKEVQTPDSEVILRRTQSFENDEKFYRKYNELRARIKANSCPILPATQTTGVLGGVNTANNYSVQRSASLKDHRHLRKPVSPPVSPTTPATTPNTGPVRSNSTKNVVGNDIKHNNVDNTASTPANQTNPKIEIKNNETGTVKSKMSPGTIFKNFFKSFVPPVRDEESETQRKAHAKRVRETRRSTQGVTLDEIKSAEELVKKKNLNNNNNNNNNSNNEIPNTPSSTNTTTTTSTTIPTNSLTTVNDRVPSTTTTTTTTTTPTTPENLDDKSIDKKSTTEQQQPSSDQISASYTIPGSILIRSRKPSSTDDDISNNSKVSATYTIQPPPPTTTTTTTTTTASTTPSTVTAYIETDLEKDRSPITNESVNVAATVNVPNNSNNKKTDDLEELTKTASPTVIQSEPSNDDKQNSTSSSETNRIRDKRSLFDIDNANSLTLAEKLRNEANKYNEASRSNNDIASVGISKNPTDNQDTDRKCDSTPSSPLHHSSSERRPSWRLKFDTGSKFKLEDASTGTFPPTNNTIITSAPAVIAAANMSSIAQRRQNNTNNSTTQTPRPVSAPVISSTAANTDNSNDKVKDPSGDVSIMLRRNKNSEDKENDKENDSRSAQATQAVIQRRRRPKRRSTGVVHVDMDDIDPDRQDSPVDNEAESGSERTSRSRLGSTSSLSGSTETKDGKKSASADTSANGEVLDYKALWEAAKFENDKLKTQLKKRDEELSTAKSAVEKFSNATTKNSLSELEKRERRAMERKLSEMEEELKQLETFKTENQRLKEENGALIRVISKLSK